MVYSLGSRVSSKDHQVLSVERGRAERRVGHVEVSCAKVPFELRGAAFFVWCAVGGHA